VDEVRKQLLVRKDRKILVPVAGLKNLKPEMTWMHEIFSPFGFNESVIADMAAALHKPGMKVFVSDQYEVVRDREYFIITRRSRRKQEGPEEEYSIRKGDTIIKRPVLMTIEEIPYQPGVSIPAGKEYASLDLEKLEFPLTLRRWKPGDAFVPFGMTTRKKISDFFIDRKVSDEEKQNAWLLWSGNKVAWVVGHRPDNRFRVTTRTRTILRIRVS
jgi:tRNA(Ile)-lysidine synthase